MVSQKMTSLNQDMENALKSIEMQPVMAIHELRKRTKYIRALLRFHPQGKALQASLKSLSNILAPYRDAQVMWDTYQACVTDNAELRKITIEDRLKKSSFLMEKLPDSAALITLHQLLASFKSQLEGHPFDPSTDHIYKGMKTSHQTGKKAFKRARQNSDFELIHIWRKKTKQLWYQLRFIFGDLHEDPDHALSLSHTLSQTLGDIHDLDVFSNSLTDLLDDTHKSHLSGKRNHLLKNAIDTGLRLDGGKSSTFYKMLVQSF